MCPSHNKNNMIFYYYYFFFKVAPFRRQNRKTCTAYMWIITNEYGLNMRKDYRTVFIDMNVWCSTFLNIWMRRTITVRLSNFDLWHPKMGVFLQGTEATPCGHPLKWKHTPENSQQRPACSWPPWPWFSREKSLKVFKVLYKKIINKRNFDPHFKNVYLARKWVWRAHIGLVWKPVLRATYSICITTVLVRPSTGAQRSAERAPKKKTFKWPSKDQSSVNKFKVSFVWILAEDVWPSKFGKCLKNTSDVTLAPKFFFS